MTNDKKILLIIDSNSVIHRAYHALPRLTTKKGEMVNAVYGFLLVFLRAIREFNPDYLVAAFDFPAPTFRHEKFKQYKAKRKRAPDDLYSQMPKVKEILRAFDVLVLEKEGFEADDIIGTVSLEFVKKQITPPPEVIIISGDTDVLQLISKNIKIYLLRRGVKDTVLYDENLVKEKYQGLLANQLRDYKALRGDPTDNVPGARGIGEKTAYELIKEFNNLEELYRELEKKSERVKKISPKIKEILLSQKEGVLLSKILVEIRKDVPIDFNLNNSLWKQYDREKIIGFLRDHEFFSLLNRLPLPNQSMEEGSGSKNLDDNTKESTICPNKKELKNNLRLW